jgi:hypothetical protein
MRITRAFWISRRAINTSKRLIAPLPRVQSARRRRALLASGPAGVGPGGRGRGRGRGTRRDTASVVGLNGLGTLRCPQQVPFPLPGPNTLLATSFPLLSSRRTVLKRSSTPAFTLTPHFCANRSNRNYFAPLAINYYSPRH